LTPDATPDLMYTAMRDIPSERRVLTNADRFVHLAAHFQYRAPSARV